jgi:AAA+ superfamily predicted ATPase
MRANESDATTRCKNTFLVKLDGIVALPKGVTVIAASNRPQHLDSSFQSQFVYINRLKIKYRYIVLNDMFFALDSASNSMSLYLTSSIDMHFSLRE